MEKEIIKVVNIDVNCFPVNIDVYCLFELWYKDLTKVLKEEKWNKSKKEIGECSATWQLWLGL